MKAGLFSKSREVLIRSVCLPSDHLIAPDGQIAAQQDAMPQQGAAPTSCWRPGEFITDPYTLTLPAQLPPGRYRLETGWYFWETGERLPVAGVEAPDNAVPLTWIQVPHE